MINVLKLATFLFLTSLASVANAATITVKQGDFNLDNAINGADIGGFVEILSQPNSSPMTLYLADFNMDGAVNGADIGGFVDLLSGTGGTRVFHIDSVSLKCSKMVFTKTGLTSTTIYDAQNRKQREELIYKNGTTPISSESIDYYHFFGTPSQSWWDYSRVNESPTVLDPTITVRKVFSNPTFTVPVTLYEQTHLRYHLNIRKLSEKFQASFFFGPGGTNLYDLRSNEVFALNGSRVLQVISDSRLSQIHSYKSNYHNYSASIPMEITIKKYIGSFLESNLQSTTNYKFDTNTGAALP